MDSLLTGMGLRSGKSLAAPRTGTGSRAAVTGGGDAPSMVPGTEGLGEAPDPIIASPSSSLLSGGRARFPFRLDTSRRTAPVVPSASVPLLSNISTNAITTFLRLEATYQQASFVGGIGPQSLLTLVAAELHPGLHAFCADYGVDLPRLSDPQRITSADRVAAEEKNDPISPYDSLWHDHLLRVALLRKASGYGLEEDIKWSDVERHLTSLRFNASLPTFHDTFDAFRMDYNVKVDSHRLSAAIAANEKDVCKLLTDRLYPPPFQGHVRDLYKSLKVKTVADWFNRLKKLEQVFDGVMLERRSSKSKKYTSSSPAAASSSATDSTASAGAGGDKKTRQPSSSTPDKPKKTPPPCLICGDAHWTSDHPGASEAQIADAKRRHEEKKKAAAAAGKDSSHSGSFPYTKTAKTKGSPAGAAAAASTSSSTRNNFVINVSSRSHGTALLGNTSVPFKLDTGADVTVISPSTASAALQGTPFTLNPLEDTVSVGGIVDGVQLRAQYSVSIPITLMYNNSVVQHYDCIEVHLLEGMPDGVLLISDSTMRDVMGIDIVGLATDTAGAGTSATVGAGSSATVGDGFTDSTAAAGSTDSSAGSTATDSTATGSTDSAAASSASLSSSISTPSSSTPLTPQVHVIDVSTSADEDCALPDDIGEHDPAEVIAILTQLLDNAREKGLTADSVALLRAAIIDGKLHDVFRVKMCGDPPAKVPPVKVIVRPEIYSQRPRYGRRHYTPTGRQFMRETIRTLEHFGFVKRATDSTFACPAYPVFKQKYDPTWPVKDQMRLTVDLRYPNSFTEPTVYPLPHPDDLPARLAGKKYFGRMDVLGGFWNFELDESCRHYFNIMTPDGIFTPTRLIQGSRNASGPYQERMEMILGDLVGTACLVFVDDIIVTGDTEPEFVNNWIRVLQRLYDFGVKITAKYGKTVFYDRELLWCGRLYSASGVRFNPDQITTIINMPPPSTAAELRSYLAMANWRRLGIPFFAEVSAPLYDILTAGLAAAKNKRQAAASRVRLTDVGWSSVHDAAFRQLNRLIAADVELAHYNPALANCIITDASKFSWAALATQCPPEHVDLPFSDQQHQLLGAFSGRFTASQLNWPTVEKEGYAIMEGLVRTAYLFPADVITHIFTDHRNLGFLFNSDIAIADGRTQAADRIERWKIIVRARNTVMHFVAGEHNPADMFTRFGAPPATASDSVSVMAVSATDSTLADSPSITDIRAAQQQCPPPSSYRLHVNADGVLVDLENRIYVPDHNALRQRLLIAAHCNNGHRGSDATAAILRQRFIWPDLDADAHKFCKECIVCVMTKGGLTIPRLLLEQDRPTAPNQSIHFDFKHIRQPTPDTLNGYKSVLVIIDRFSKFVELVPVAKENSESVALALLEHFKRFGVVKHWTSDRGQHFFNDVITRLAELLDCHHHFCAAHAPWSNGAVERVNLEIRKILSALHIQHAVPDEQWPYLLPTVNAIINNTPSPSLAGYAPITVHTGAAPSATIDAVYNPRSPTFTRLNITAPELEEHVTALQSALADIHGAVRSRPSRKKDQRARSPVDFVIGDYVLVSNVINDVPKDATRAIWHSLAQVRTALNERTFVVKDIVTQRDRIVHAEHLKRYAGADLVITPELLALITRGSTGSVLQEIMAHHHIEGQWYLEIRWEDQPSTTIEPLLRVYEDAPRRVRGYAQRSQDTDLINSLPPPKRRGGASL